MKRGVKKGGRGGGGNISARGGGCLLFQLYLLAVENAMANSVLQCKFTVLFVLATAGCRGWGGGKNTENTGDREIDRDGEGESERERERNSDRMEMRHRKKRK